jgi:hypothetical protein
MSSLSAFKEAVYNFFHASRESVIEVRACNNWLTTTKFELMYDSLG